jgi:hypothetical protein
LNKNNNSYPKYNVFIAPEAIALYCLILLSIIVLPLNFTGDRSDGIFHYLISKTALKHPHHFFDLWNKPVFTLIAMPFAQFGLKGMHFMNILIACLTGLILHKTAKRLNLNFPWLAFIFLLCTPVYFNQLYTAMTEPLFALHLTWIVYLYIDKKYASAAFFASLLPLTRQEGYLLIPVLLVLYAFTKKWRYIPQLFSGLLFYSLIGYVFMDDFFILINRNPYNGEELYGHGTFFHFFERSEIMFGILLEVLMLVGILISALRLRLLFSKNNFEGNQIGKKNVVTEFFLIAGYSVGFFMAHVIMWWKGIFSSYGLERVMACVVPLYVLLALRTVTSLYRIFKKRNSVKLSIMFGLVFSSASIWVLISRSSFPPKENIRYQELVLKDAAAWVMKNKVQYSKIYFGNPYNILLYDLNPKEQIDSDELMYAGEVSNMKDQSLIIWDSEFGPGTRFGKEKITSDSNAVFLKSFGFENYEVALFKKIKK